MALTQGGEGRVGNYRARVENIEGTQAGLVLGSDVSVGNEGVLGVRQ